MEHDGRQPGGGEDRGGVGGSSLRLSSDLSHLRIGWSAGSAGIVSRKRTDRCSAGARCSASRTSSKARSWYRVTRRTATGPVLRDSASAAMAACA